MRDFCIIQGHPAPVDIAPYIAILIEDTGAEVDGIYRGQDAYELLKAHGHYSQSEVYYADEETRQRQGTLRSLNAPGYSTHELRSDGEAYPYVPRGEPLEWWQLGFGVDLDHSDAVVACGKSYGWKLFHPYEIFHDHINFREPPQVWHTAVMARILSLRETLPRS
jgi:hypothetical protein